MSSSAARELGITASGEPYGGGEEDIGDNVKLLLEQMMAEAALEEKLADMVTIWTRINRLVRTKEVLKVKKAPWLRLATGGYTSWGKEADKFPWCCICNNDAVLRCQECDGDLYCQRCFSKGHEQFGLFDHHYTIYEPPAKRDKYLWCSGLCKAACNYKFWLHTLQLSFT